MNFNGVQHHWWEQIQKRTGCFCSSPPVPTITFLLSCGCESVEEMVVYNTMYCQMHCPQGTIMTNICVSTWTQDPGLTFSFLDTFPFKLFSLPSIFTLKGQAGGGTSSPTQSTLYPAPCGKEDVFCSTACKRRSSITPDHS